MKAAYYAIAVIVFGLFGIVLISLFGDITVTNQQDYTLLKNAVEAAMYDSVDLVSKTKGFCLCTNISQTNGRFVFNSKNDYVIRNLGNNETFCNVSGYSYCQKLEGEIKINEEVFAESFTRRFTENVKGDKNYKIIIQEVIEYPPKVSVEVRSYSNYNLFQSTSGTFTDADFDISNKIDSIFENR